MVTLHSNRIFVDYPYPHASKPMCLQDALFSLIVLLSLFTHIPLNNTPLSIHTAHMDPKTNFINLSSDSDETRPGFANQPTFWPTKSPFLCTSDEESEERKVDPTPACPTKSPFLFTSDEESEEEKPHPAPKDEPSWMSYFPPSTSMPFYEPGVTFGSYFPSTPAGNEEEEEALEIPPLAIVYPGEKFPPEVGSSKRASNKKSKKAKPVKPPKTGRGKGKRGGD